MGTLLGHVAPGLSFILVGLWHLFNHIKLNALRPNSDKSSPWFPASKIRYLELYFIISAASFSISLELFIGRPHRPLDHSDDTIRSAHLLYFQHTNISLVFLAFAFFSILADRLSPPAHRALSSLLYAAAYAHQLLVFRLHPSAELEGHYHWLIQIVTAATVVTTLLGIRHPKSFANSFARSVSILLLGVWFVLLGIMMYTPSLMPKGCFVVLENRGMVARCFGGKALEQAEALVSIQFGWCFIGVLIFAFTLYLAMTKFYSPKVVEYQTLSRYGCDDDGDHGSGDGDDEAQIKKANDVV